MSYSNFKDPTGLLFRMLRSGNKTAYFILFREAFAILLKPLDWLLQFNERKILRRATPQEQAVILIVGGSRSGTTLLYQVLAQYLPVSYISNFVSSFNRSPITSYKWFHRFLSKPRAPFKNYYGSAYGQGAPNDAFPIWNRWMGPDRNHISGDIRPEQKEDMRRFMNAWHGITGKSFLNKNNRNSLCIPELDDTFPNVLFVEIHRDPIYVAQSLVFSRKDVQGDENIAWGLLSEEAEDLSDPLSHIDQICRQVHAVDKMIAEGRAKVDASRYYKVSYEAFCENPANIVRDIANRAMGVHLPEAALEGLSPFNNTNRKRLDDAAFFRIGKCIAELYGNDSVSQLAESVEKEPRTQLAKDE